MKMMIFDIRRIFKLSWKRKRTWGYLFQYLWNGYSDIDTWSVDYYVACKALPVMEQYRKVAPSGIRIDSEDQIELEEALVACRGMAYGNPPLLEKYYGEDFQLKFSNILRKFWW